MKKKWRDQFWDYNSAIVPLHFSRTRNEETPPIRLVKQNDRLPILFVVSLVAIFEETKNGQQNTPRLEINHNNYENLKQKTTFAATPF